MRFILHPSVGLFDFNQVIVERFIMCVANGRNDHDLSHICNSLFSVSQYYLVVFGCFALASKARITLYYCKLCTHFFEKKQTLECHICHLP